MEKKSIERRRKVSIGPDFNGFLSLRESMRESKNKVVIQGLPSDNETVWVIGGIERELMDFIELERSVAPYTMHETSIVEPTEDVIAIQDVLGGIVSCKTKIDTSICLPSGDELMKKDGSSDVITGRHIYVRNEGSGVLTIDKSKNWILRGNMVIAPNSCLHLFLQYATGESGICHAYTL